MSNVRPHRQVYTIKETGKVENIANEKPKETFRKAFVYPGAPQDNGELSVNGANLKIGKDCNTQKVVTDTVRPDDVPLEIPMPENKDESMPLNDILIKGTQGDSITVEYWP